jgi:hypothetical protein|tara:strand:- start:683 stop:910 length:228 start_codon:yes stop_codon:yes gene_type:complete
MYDGYMKIDTLSRIVGSVLVVTAYFIIVHVNVVIGTMIHAVACLMSIPFFIRTRAWDVVTMLSFMTCVSFTKFAL